MNENEKDISEEEAPSPEAEKAEEEKEEAPAEEEKEPNRKERKEIKALKAENEKLKAQAKESEDKYMRMIAEYDNYRKRTAKEREGIYTDACADMLKEILPVKDALEMAVAYGDGGKVVEGVKMTLSKFDEAFKKLGLEAIGEVGEQFDPELHNAVMHEENEELGENVISQVLMKGYKKGDKILRHAMVKVAN